MIYPPSRWQLINRKLDNTSFSPAAINEIEKVETLRYDKARTRMLFYGMLILLQFIRLLT